MRLAWYAGVSTALAASVVVSAFHQRANFYSAMVYLAQSNFCLLVLVNFIYLIYGVLIYGLQRLLYGPLRQVEVEQLSEKAWFAITETCLAMTIFREEIGAWFLVMFTALVTGKVWGWIGDGRVEVLEQQPPANPGLFHTRLSISLLLSLLYDTWLLRYTVTTVIQQARPNMMVMFLFEFAVLATCSARTGIRYMVSIVEQNIVKTQTRHRLEERRRQVREEREELIRQREHDGGSSGEDQTDLPREEDIDEMDIEVPGWEAKGQWILILDLIADCVKLVIYLVFFGILLTFYGLPIHIMRDLFMTARSVIKRGSALWRYRKAVEDMNKYPDATQEELAREDTCIICREEMRPWDPSNGTVERIRPKKLPCGHILHFGCLKSWLERQQVCPTCRSPVVVNDNAAAPQNRDARLARIGLGGLGVAAAAPVGQQQPADNAAGLAPGPQPAQQAPRNGAARVFQLGPIRLGFAQGENMQQLAQQMGIPAEAIPMPLAQGAPAGPFTPAAQPPGGNSEVTHQSEPTAAVAQEPVAGATQYSESNPAQSTSFSALPTEPEQRQEPAVSGPSITIAQTQSPPVLAPNPVLPNWGGANQLFGNGPGVPSLGNRAPSETSVDEVPKQDESAPHSAADKSTSPPAREGNVEEDSTSGSSSNKGKARAVTVEEADDDE
ncbi:ERAD-associated E3 ubiquitin-protein ligase HRD1A [Colletotrichum higginsianum]|uniref:RING-type E3 ubiquitin transferase n=1 Tax=Colletotrichum higginsianum TaxID=80884 RepID=A0A4V4NA22_9PEZI|nr:ERAD-associated E3 ubiquitin-protein ligase HRD1A [Colletotrichum higginsianum]